MSTAASFPVVAEPAAPAATPSLPVAPEQLAYMRQALDAAEAERRQPIL